MITAADLASQEDENGIPFVRPALYSIVMECLQRIIVKNYHENIIIKSSILEDLLLADDTNDASYPSPLDLREMLLTKYPKRPYYSYIADSLYVLCETGQLPKPPSAGTSGGQELKVDRGKIIDELLTLTRRINSEVKKSNRQFQTMIDVTCSTWWQHFISYISPPGSGYEKKDSGDEVSRSIDKRKVSLVCYPSSTHSCRLLISERTVSELMHVLEKMGPFGLLSFLGMRHTVGTIPRCPPSKNLLMESFARLHSLDSKSILTTGARAHSKHSIRSSEKFWGTCEGSEAAKNKQALCKLQYILDHTVWINVHMLSGEGNGLVLEVRSKQGYGARWRISQMKALHTGLTPQIRCAKIAAEFASESAVSRIEDITPSCSTSPQDIDLNVKAPSKNSKTEISEKDVEETPCISLSFRGFLEPHMEDGHKKGWKH